MGRAFNSLVQEMRIADDKSYAILKAELKRELIASIERFVDLRVQCDSRLLGPDFALFSGRGLVQIATPV